MNHPDFSLIRCLLDEALTYQDAASAGKLADEGLVLAQKRECLSEFFYFKAQQEIIADRYESAVAYLEKALRYNPTDGAAYNDLALCKISLGFINGVEALFDEGIAVEPAYATIHHNKGWFLNNLGRHSEALGIFHVTLELEPDRAVTYENMADAYEKLGRIPEALEAYQRALMLLRTPSPLIRSQLLSEIDRLKKQM